MPVYRIEVRCRPNQIDPRATNVARNAESFLKISDVTIRSADIYLVEGGFESRELTALAESLLADPVIQEYEILKDANGRTSTNSLPAKMIEVHPLPGVMDPVAISVESSIRTLFGKDAAVRTGVQYEFDESTASGDIDEIANRLLSNPIVHEIHREAYLPNSIPKGHQYEMEVRSIPICDLDEASLEAMSREAHLFLSLEEMQAVQKYYQEMGREPRDVELETIAQTWSEHCVHKTLKSTIRFEGYIPNADSRPGHIVNADGSVTIHNLLKSTVAAATHELMNDGIDWCLSVFVDNAGIVQFDDDTAVCFKVETHNHPSALEPYGGAATGIGGCIRDIMGTGLAARPIASTDVFCVADPVIDTVPAGCLHPRRILSQVVAGVRDYGNRMGIPTVNGAVSFDNAYVGNPLVYVGCVGVMPIDKIAGDAQPGDHIIVLGGRTGRDGIHGATFSSAELTDTHADEFSHAVQIGNAITEKKTLDAILQMRDHADGCLFTSITDCGAGGFSSAVGEMGEQLGADVHLERAPLKYDGLSYTEIWISEAQERMVLAVPAGKIASVQAICDTEDVELCDLGTFGTDNRELILHYDGAEVGRLSMEFLHDGVPMPTREAVWTAADQTCDSVVDELQTASTNHELLIALLQHPNIASKHWIVRQYDHEVQGRTVVRPFTGEDRHGPSDAAVVLPKRDSNRGLAIANGLATGFRDDPYQMVLHAADECVRNLVCTGVDPTRIAILDNFCWPSCGKAENLGSLVLAAEACYDAAKAFRMPFISGKDSLNNQFTTESGETIEIPPTLLISGFGIVHDVRECVTTDAKRAGNVLLVVGDTSNALRGSHVFSMLTPDQRNVRIPEVDLSQAVKNAHAVSSLIDNGLVRSAHDCSDGGLLIAAAEMAMGGKIGLQLDISNLPLASKDCDDLTKLFGECASRYLLEIEPKHLETVARMLADVSWAQVGEFNTTDALTVNNIADPIDVLLDDMHTAWRAPLDW